MSAQRARVAVVGLGPVGATLTGLLGRRGVDVIAVERDNNVFPLPRAAHIDHTGLRALEAVGCLEQVLPGLIPNPGIDFVGLGGELIMRVPADNSRPEELPTSSYFHQPSVDRVLRRTAIANPTVDALLETEAVAVETSRDHALVRTLRSGRTEEIHAEYVVACDGASSLIRESLGIAMDDIGSHERWLVIDLKLVRRPQRLSDRAVYYCNASRPYVLIPMPGDRHRIEIMLLPEDTPAAMQDRDHVLRLLAALVPGGEIEIERAAVYTFHGLIARDWRVGRVFLAGDAAHQMPPFLGQGMCSGIRDAVNLAWKLDLVLAGIAPESLLGTYQQERQPHVEVIARRAIEYGAIVSTLDPVAAERRDESLRRDHTGLQFSLPPLAEGPLIMPGGGAFVGTRLPIEGPGTFVVIGRNDAALGHSCRWWSEAVDATTLVMEDLPEEHPLRLWFERRANEVAVIRPDRYLLATENLDKATERVRRLLAPRVALHI